MTAAEAARGWLAPEVAGEFPELALWWSPVASVAARTGEAAVRERLRALSDRFRGARAATLRSEPVPHAYRAFCRQIGLDPDVDRVPVEALAVERLMAGGLRSGTVLQDAVTIAIMETGVGVWALDGDTVRPPLGIRLAEEGEPLGRGSQAGWLPAGRLVIADEAGAVATLFGDVARGHAAGPRTRRGVVYAVQVAGVPDLNVSEALWTVADLAGQAGG